MAQAKVNHATAINNDPWDDGLKPAVPKVLLSIEGLEVFSHDEVTGKTMFQLTGVEQKNRNWGEAMYALGYEKASDRDKDELCDKLSVILFEHDVMKVLASRVKPA